LSPVIWLAKCEQQITVNANTLNALFMGVLKK